MFASLSIPQPPLHPLHPEVCISSQGNYISKDFVQVFDKLRVAVICMYVPMKCILQMCHRLHERGGKFWGGNFGCQEGSFFESEFPVNCTFCEVDGSNIHPGILFLEVSESKLCYHPELHRN